MHHVPHSALLLRVRPGKEKKEGNARSQRPTSHARVSRKARALLQRKLQTTIISLIPGKHFTVEYSCPSIIELGADQRDAP